MLMTFFNPSYTDYREPPGSEKSYHLTNTFYIILACRLGFVVVFEVSCRQCVLHLFVYLYNFINA